MSEDSVELFTCPSCKKPSRRSDFQEFEEWLVKEHGIERVKTLSPGEHGQEFNRFMMHKAGIDQPTRISPTAPPEKEPEEKAQIEEDGPELYCIFCSYQQKHPQSDFDKGLITCKNCGRQTNLKELDDEMIKGMKV